MNVTSLRFETQTKTASSLLFSDLSSNKRSPLSKSDNQLLSFSTSTLQNSRTAKMVGSDSESNRKTETIKFLCSYGGRILPRSKDGVLRYVGGTTRVLAVDRSISFAELMVKLGEFCGYSVELRCQLPDGDLETLVSIKSEEELRNLIEEYDGSCPGSKIRAILFPPKSLKKISPPTSNTSSIDFSPTKSIINAFNYRRTRSSSPPAAGYKVYYSPSRRQELLCCNSGCYGPYWH